MTRPRSTKRFRPLFRLEVEKLEDRYCPAGSISLTAQALAGQQVQLSGLVTGDNVANVALTFTGAAAGSTVTDANGNFTYVASQATLGTVTASGVDLDAAYADIMVSPPSISTLTITVGTQKSVTVSGTLTDIDAAGQSITFSGIAGGTAHTDSSGHFSFTATVSGMGEIRARATNPWGQTAGATEYVWVDAPSISGLTIDYGAQKTVTVSGTVTDIDAAGLTVTFTGVASGTVITDSTGHFSFTTAPSSLGSIYATTTNLWGQVSNPSDVMVMSMPPMILSFEGQNQAGDMWVFHGIVSDEWAEGLVISFTGPGGIDGKTATVQADGTFCFSWDMPEGENGTVTAITTDWWGLDSAVAWAFAF